MFRIRWWVGWNVKRYLGKSNGATRKRLTAHQVNNCYFFRVTGLVDGVVVRVRVVVRWRINQSISQSIDYQSINQSIRLEWITTNKYSVQQRRLDRCMNEFNVAWTLWIMDYSNYETFAKNRNETETVPANHREGDTKTRTKRRPQPTKTRKQPFRLLT